ncbi:MAG TPA: tetraacyldisaccharide 4'-kinase, partial [Lacipirellulaceae bacterium]|nr:tetraacyldisaccharide 4'-kinase [Lacipirellulaceae bacterium]
YNTGRSEIHHVSVPVISVGNLTLGGTGKTPLVKWLARKLQALGASIAIVSRGYGAAAGQQNDEALELAQALPNVPHIQNRDRAAGAQQAIDQFKPDLLILDDGFQHRRLARDLDIVLLDALEPFGFDHVFPRGMLREPLAGLDRARVVCLSRADAVPASTRESIRRRVADIAPSAIWCELAHVATALTNAADLTAQLETVHGKRIAAFCAIGNPAGFRHTLSTLGCEIVAWREFPDHHLFTPLELASFSDAARRCNAELILCTQKDLVKSPQERFGDIPLWAVTIEMQFLAGQQLFEEQLTRVARANLRERQ